MNRLDSRLRGNDNRFFSIDLPNSDLAEAHALLYSYLHSQRVCYLEEKLKGRIPARVFKTGDHGLLDVNPPGKLSLGDILFQPDVDQFSDQLVLRLFPWLEPVFRRSR